MSRVLKIFATAILLSSFSLSATAIPPEGGIPSPKYGVITLSANNLREAPDFTAELGNQLLMGTPVEIVGEESYWKKVISPDPYTAWCVDLSLKEMSEEELGQYISAPKWIVTVAYSAVLKQPKNKTDQISYLVMGDLLLDTGKSKGAFREVMLPSGTTGYVHKKDIRPFKQWAQTCDPTPDRIIETALQFLGVPYLWGGTSIKGVDCSGLTRMVWFMNGILLPRNASQQAKVGIEVPLYAGDATAEQIAVADKEIAAAGGDEVAERIAAAMKIRDLRKGDLVFFGTAARRDEVGVEIQRERVTHVGIYIGDGRFIHASKYVRINSLIPGDPDWYDRSSTLIRARRIVPSEGVTPILLSPAYFPQN